MALDQITRDRLKKLKNIIDAGLDPYPPTSKREQFIEDALSSIGKKVYVAGRLRSLRPHGKISFADLEDQSGKIQLFFSQNELKGSEYDFLNNLDIGDFIEAGGEVFKTQSGQITVRVEEYRLLTKSLKPLPSEHFGLKDTEERLRKRYLDLILSPQVKNDFVVKSKFWNEVRNYLVNKDFLEVETPVLQPIPGGADARPFVTHHNAQDMKLYLRISLELYLKRLLVGGYEKVFEIGRVFRNEGIDDEHLQDYTLLEFYWAYADYEDLMDFVEDMFKTVIQNTFGTLTTMWGGQKINWGKRWPRVDYYKLLESEWGIDLESSGVDDLYKLAQKLNVKVEPNLSKGRLIDYIYKKTIRPNLIQPQFLINPPAELVPLAKRDPKNPNKVQRMQVLATGSELGNGYSELNDPIDQLNRFKDQMDLRKKGDDEAQMMDEDFVEALEYGMPPAAGFGMSERTISRLFDKTMREMVFFPTMKAEKKGKK